MNLLEEIEEKTGRLKKDGAFYMVVRRIDTIDFFMRLTLIMSVTALLISVLALILK